LFGPILDSEDDLTGLDEKIEERSIRRKEASDHDGNEHCRQGAEGAGDFAVPAPASHQSTEEQSLRAAPV